MTPSEQAQLRALSRDVMNLKTGVTNDLRDAEMQAYRRGHRDARHAACELINALLAQTDAAPQPRQKAVFMPPPFDKQELTRRVAGAVKCALDAHGPITPMDYSAAVKRITGELYVRKAVQPPGEPSPLESGNT